MCRVLVVVMEERGGEEEEEGQSVLVDVWESRRNDATLLVMT